MLRYKTETRPGVVALYNIRPGNTAVNSYTPGARMGWSWNGCCKLLLLNKCLVMMWSMLEPPP